MEFIYSFSFPESGLLTPRLLLGRVDARAQQRLHSQAEVDGYGSDDDDDESIVVLGPRGIRYPPPSRVGRYGISATVCTDWIERCEESNPKTFAIQASAIRSLSSFLVHQCMPGRMPSLTVWRESSTDTDPATLAVSLNPSLTRHLSIDIQPLAMVQGRGKHWVRYLHWGSDEETIIWNSLFTIIFTISPIIIASLSMLQRWYKMVKRIPIQLRNTIIVIIISFKILNTMD